MRFLATIFLAVFTAGVSALPVAAPPSLVHPPVQAFKDEVAVEAVDPEPNVEARSDIAVDAVDVPNIEARDEAVTDAVDVEPNIKARSETTVDAADVDAEPNIKARDEAVSDATKEPEIEAKDDSPIQARNEAGGRYDNHPYDYRPVDYTYHPPSSRASRGEHNTPADDWKYRDNLDKLHRGDCGVGCHNSINSYQSVASKDSRLARQRKEKEYYNNYNHHNTGYDHHVNKDYTKDYHTNGYDHHVNKDYTKDYHGYDHHTNGNYHPPPPRSSRASRGEHNTKADDYKYRQNLGKLHRDDCGKGCHHSIYSYQSVASKDSKASRAARNRNDYHHPNDYHHH